MTRKYDKRKEIIPPDIQKALDDVDAEYQLQTLAVQENTQILEGQVREAVLQNGASVKGSTLQAVWSKGRVSWDTKALDGYAASHPEIAQFRKEGAPSVSIRNV